MQSCYFFRFTYFNDEQQLFKEECRSLSNSEQSYKSWPVTSLFVWLEIPPESCARTLSPGLPLSHFLSSTNKTLTYYFAVCCVCVRACVWTQATKQTGHMTQKKCFKIGFTIQNNLWQTHTHKNRYDTSYLSLYDQVLNATINDAFYFSVVNFLIPSFCLWFFFGLPSYKWMGHCYLDIRSTNYFAFKHKYHIVISIKSNSLTKFYTKCFYFFLNIAMVQRTNCCCSIQTYVYQFVINSVKTLHTNQIFILHHVIKHGAGPWCTVI